MAADGLTVTRAATGQSKGPLLRLRSGREELRKCQLVRLRHIVCRACDQEDGMRLEAECLRHGEVRTRIGLIESGALRAHDDLEVSHWSRWPSVPPASANNW